MSTDYRPDFRPVTGYGSIRPSDIVHDQYLKKAAKAREHRIRKEIAEDLTEEIEDFEHKMGWRMRSRLGLTCIERREIEKIEQRTMGIKPPVEPRPKSPLLLYDYSQSPNMNISEYSYLNQQEVPMRTSPCSSWNGTSNNSFRNSVASPLTRAHTAPIATAGPLRNSSRLWTSHSMIEPIFLPSSRAHRSATDRFAHTSTSLILDEKRKLRKSFLVGLRTEFSNNADDQSLPRLEALHCSDLRIRFKHSALKQQNKARNTYPILDPSTRSEIEFRR
jgi:hypothetical protein